jgi:hypothetical protein
MPNSYVDYSSATSDQIDNGFIFAFPFLSDDEGNPLIDVYVEGVKLASNLFTISSNGSTTKAVINAGSVVAGNAVKVVRNSSTEDPLVDFVDGSVLTEDTLDLSYKHGFYLSQEAAEGSGGEQLSKKGGTNYDADGVKIADLAGPTDAQDAATKAYVDQTIDNAELVGGSPATVSLGVYDVTSTNATLKQLRAWTADIETNASDISTANIDVTSTGSTTARSLADRFADVLSVKDFGAVGDGTTDDTAAIQSAISAGVNLIVPEGIYLISAALTFPDTIYVKFNTDAFFKQTSGTSVINSKIIADSFPVLQGAGSITINPIAWTVGTSGDYQDIQTAVDNVPNYLWQRYTITLDDGTYNEDVRIENKTGACHITTGGERAGLIIVGTTKTATFVKSFLVISCGGSAFYPLIQNLTVNGVNTITNENSSIEFYGCPSGAVASVNFTASADRCITSYGSKISVEGCDFGTSSYNYAFVTKHGGEIYSPNSQALGAGTDHTGTLNSAVGRVITGKINAATLASVKSSGTSKHDVVGLRSGFIYDASERTIYGPNLFSKSVSHYHTFFENVSNFESYVTAGSSATYTTSRGVTLNSITSGTSSLWVRRLEGVRGYSTDDVKTSELIVSLFLDSITGDGSIELSNFGSVVEGGYGIEINVANGARGFYNNAGTKTYTSTLFSYADLTAKHMIAYISCDSQRNIEFDLRRNVGSYYEVQTQRLDGSSVTTVSSTFALAVTALGGSTGTANAVFSEARSGRL